MFSNIKVMKGSQFSYVFENDAPKLPRKRKVLSYYEEKEAPVEFVSKVEEYYLHFFYQAIEQLLTVFLIDFSKKTTLKLFRKWQQCFLKALRDEDFDHKLQQMSLFFSSDLHKFKLKTQLKTLTHVADEKQVAIKDVTTIISSLNAS